MEFDEGLVQGMEKGKGEREDGRELLDFKNGVAGAKRPKYFFAPTSSEKASPPPLFNHPQPRILSTSGS